MEAVQCWSAAGPIGFLTRLWLALLLARSCATLLRRLAGVAVCSRQPHWQRPALQILPRAHTLPLQGEGEKEVEASWLAV